MREAYVALTATSYNAWYMSSDISVVKPVIETLTALASVKLYNASVHVFPVRPGRPSRRLK